jgi:hypothetical protein
MDFKNWLTTEEDIFDKIGNQNLQGITNKMTYRNPSKFLKSIPDQHKKGDSIVVGCPECDNTFSVPAWLDNKYFHCPECQERIPNLQAERDAQDIRRQL